LKEKAESEILKEHENQAKEKVDYIVSIAEKFGISVKTYIDTGRFGLKCVEIAKIENPELIITTRSKRPEWIKKLFGSPVDYLIKKSGCKVIEF
jgi:nucleotide-binding universal stress UspA family protein